MEEAIVKLKSTLTLNKPPIIQELVAFYESMLDKMNNSQVKISLSKIEADAEYQVKIEELIAYIFCAISQ